MIFFLQFSKIWIFDGFRDFFKFLSQNFSSYLCIGHKYSKYMYNQTTCAAKETAPWWWKEELLKTWKGCLFLRFSVCEWVCLIHSHSAQVTTFEPGKCVLKGYMEKNQFSEIFIFDVFRAFFQQQQKSDFFLL